MGLTKNLQMVPDWLDRSEYPFAPRYVELAPGKMHYVDEGRGEPILFVHGTPTWSFDFRHLIKALSKQARCIAPDLFGFGLSDRPADFEYSPEAHARELNAFVDALGLTKFTLVVHDFGGPIGLPLLLDSPDTPRGSQGTEETARVARLVVMNSFMWPIEDAAMLRGARVIGSGLGRWMYRHLNFSLRVLMPTSYGDRKKLTPALHRQYLEVFKDKDARVLVLHALARALTQSQSFYAQLLSKADRLQGTPTLLVWGMKDHAFGPPFLARWKQLVPQAVVEEIAAAGHWPHEESPERVINALRAFVEPGLKPRPT